MKGISKRFEDMFFWRFWFRKKFNKKPFMKKAEKRGIYANTEFYELALISWKDGYLQGKIDQRRKEKKT